MWLVNEDLTLIVKAQEGSGSALEMEDIGEDIVDYIYYDIYKSIDDVANDNIYDGGCILLTKLYQDMTRQEIIDTISKFIGVKYDNKTKRFIQ